MSAEIIDFGAIPRRVCTEGATEAMAEMTAAVDEVKAAHKSGDWFAMQRAYDREHAARIRLLSFMRHD